MIFNWFKQDKKPVISQDLERRRIRNEARFEALKKQMESEGKHMLSQSFKWIPSDRWAAEKGIF